MVRWRLAQWRAAAQPSSTTSSSGPLPDSFALGFSSGWASARITSLRFFLLAKASVSGFLEVLPSLTRRWNTGLSCSRKRIHSDTARSAPDNRKGNRQPHSPNASLPNWTRVNRMTIRLRNRPTVAVVWIQLV